MHDIPYIDIHTHSKEQANKGLSVVNATWNDLESLSNHPSISVGIHPWDIDKTDTSAALQQLEELVNKDNVVAIGEIGLDRLTSTGLAVQEDLFRQQIKIAEQAGKPIIIHCVKCFPELLKIKKDSKSSIPWIIHGYQKNMQIAMSLLDAGCYLSFGEKLICSKALQEVFRSIPNDRIFLETDESKSGIIEMYQAAASAKGLTTAELKQIIETNYITCIQR